MGYSYMNQSCSCPSQPMQPSRVRSTMVQTNQVNQTAMNQANQMAMNQTTQAAMNQANYNAYCPNTAPGYLEQYPVGMGYVPWQQWQQTYPLEQGFNRGTIFPDLDLPFMMGRCVRS